MTMPADPQIIASVFRRKGEEGFQTKLFENLSARVQNDILAEAALGPNEEPVIARFDGTSEWFLITTQRLAWKNTEGLDSINILELDHVESGFEVAYKRWMAAGYPESRNPKLEIDELNVVAIDGRRAVIPMEPGRAYCGTLNTVMWLCTWPRSQRAKAAEADTND